MTEYVEITVAGSDRPALVDACDAERVRCHRWRLQRDNKGRVSGATTKIGGRWVYLHRFVLGLADPSIQGDHKNLDVHDCRRSNLRGATNGLNNANRSRRHDNASGFKGASWNSYHRKWHAQIKVDRRTIHLGYFDSVEAAASAYDDAARLYFGDFCRVNFPREGERAA